MADNIEDLGTSPIIFNEKANFKKKPVKKFTNKSKVLQFTGTILTPLEIADTVPLTMDKQYLCESPKYKRILQFWLDRKAMVNGFWFYSEYNTFRLYAPITLGSNILQIEKDGFSGIYEGYERLYFLLSNGDIITRKINSVTDNAGDYTDLTVETSFDRNIALDEVRLFGRIFYGRFNVETIDVKNFSPCVKEFNLSFYELTKEYPSP